MPLLDLDDGAEELVEIDECDHRVEAWMRDILTSIKESLNDPDSPVSKLLTEFDLVGNRARTTLLPELGTVPHVFYIDAEGTIGAAYTKGEEFKDEVY